MHGSEDEKETSVALLLGLEYRYRYPYGDYKGCNKGPSCSRESYLHAFLQ
jgi:hypothetical protein